MTNLKIPEPNILDGYSKSIQFLLNQFGPISQGVSLIIQLFGEPYEYKFKEFLKNIIDIINEMEQKIEGQQEEIIALRGSIKNSIKIALESEENDEILKVLLNTVKNTNNQKQNSSERKIFYNLIAKLTREHFLILKHIGSWTKKGLTNSRDIKPIAYENEIDGISNFLKLEKGLVIACVSDFKNSGIITESNSSYSEGIMFTSLGKKFNDFVNSNN